MTRKEYLEAQKNKQMKQINENERPGIYFISPTTLHEYLLIHSRLEKFEEGHDTSLELTEDDYKAFDTNLEKIIESITYHDADLDSEVKQSVGMMEQTGWTWQNHCPDEEEFVHCIRELYEHALDQNHCKAYASSGGITVELDIYDHSVKVTFGHIDVWTSDSDDSF